MSRLGIQIKRLREAKNLTRKQLGKAVGVSESFVLDIETGKKVVSDDLIKKFSKVLEQEINDVMVLDAESGAKEEKTIVQSTGVIEKPAEKKVQAIWSDALESVLKTVPVYEYDLEKVVETRQLPVIANKIEGYSKDRVLFLRIMDNEMIGFRIVKGDTAFVYTTHEVENNSICLVEYEGKRVIRQIKRLDGGKVLLISNKGTISTDTLSEKSLKVLARLVKLEIRL